MATDQNPDSDPAACSEGSTTRRRWWHYTLGRTVIMVIADGVIRRAERFVRKGERKAVWFSSRERWEPTATKTFAAPTGVHPATIAEMLQFAGALARVEVPESDREVYVGGPQADRRRRPAHPRRP